MKKKFYTFAEISNLLDMLKSKDVNDEHIKETKEKISELLNNQNEDIRNSFIEYYLYEKGEGTQRLYDII